MMVSYDYDNELNHCIIRMGNLNEDVISVSDPYDTDVDIIIGPCAYANDSVLRLAVLPDRVVRVDEYAFMNDTRLCEIRFSRRIEHIGKNVVRNCCALRKVIVSKNTKIDKDAFVDCGNFDIVYWEDIDERQREYLEFAKQNTFDESDWDKVVFEDPDAGDGDSKEAESMSLHELKEYDSKQRSACEPVEKEYWAAEKVDSGLEPVDDE